MISNQRFESEYQKFYEYHEDKLKPSIVSYFGINISERKEKLPGFKLYYKNSYSKSKSTPLIEYLQGLDMIRYLTMVDDEVGGSHLRFDIGLKNRNNHNMEELFNWLAKHTSLSASNLSQIQNLAKMKNTELADHDYASLYFVGFISSDDSIKVSKFHYFNRVCSDPNVLHKNIRFDDNYFLSYLETSSISTFEILSPMMRDILNECGGNLWMTGVDFDNSQISKCKIYLKSPVSLYPALIGYFESMGNYRISEQIEIIQNWNTMHTDYSCEGFAVCIDNVGLLSLNFYYVLH